MRKIFIFLFFVCITTVTNSQPVQTNGVLSVKGTQLINEKGEAIVLRGVSFGWHNLWPRFYTAQTVDWLINDWNCTVIRAAMGIELEDAYQTKPEFAKKTIKTVIDAAIERDVYVIVDWHSHGLNETIALEYFKEIAKTYGKYPHIIYEIFNEPDYETWKDVKTYSEKLIKEIRKYDPDNIILVGCPHWGQDVHIVADSPIEGVNNIMYTLHYYAATHSDSLRKRGDYALSKNIPLFISECAGMEANGDGNLNMNEWQKWIDWTEDNKISWVVWSIADKNETCSMLKPKASSTGNWPIEHLKESGIKTRELIHKYNK